MLASRIYIYPVSTLILLFAVIIGYIGTFGGPSQQIVKLWFLKPHSYAHGSLILVASVYMIISQRNVYRQLSIQPSFVYGIFLTLSAGVLYLGGELLFIITFKQISTIVALLGMSTLLLGFKFLKVLFLPVSYLIFMFPIFGTFLGKHILILQNLSAAIASQLLSASGFSVFRQGHLVELSHISLDVVKSCSGLNHIVSLAAISVPMAFFMRFSSLGKSLLIVISVAIGIFANGARVALIGVWTKYFPNAGIHGPGDTLLISFIFIFGLVTLILIALLLGKFKMIHNPLKTDSRLKESKLALPTRQINYAASIAVFIFLSVKVATVYYNVQPIKLDQTKIVLPVKIGGWEEIEPSAGDLSMLKGIPDDTLLHRIYKNSSGSTVLVLVDYFEKQQEGKELIQSPIYQMTEGKPLYPIQLALPESKTFRTHLFQYQDQFFQVFTIILINGDIISNPSGAKIETLRNILTNKKSNGMLTVLMADTTLGSTDERQAVELSELAKSLIVHLNSVIP